VSDIASDVVAGEVSDVVSEIVSQSDVASTLAAWLNLSEVCREEGTTPNLFRGFFVAAAGPSWLKKSPSGSEKARQKAPATIDIAEKNMNSNIGTKLSNENLK
jgi:hypothetical protein